MLNMNVKIYDCKIIGDNVCEKFIDGKIVKVNVKSIRVQMTHKKYTKNGKIMNECDMNEVAIFTLCKVGTNGIYYKNRIFGVIEICQ